MGGPRIPTTWFSPKGAALGALAAGGGGWLAIKFLGVAWVVLLSPVLAFFATIPIVTIFSWAAGRGQRAYRFGTGRQEVWGYCGHSVRGIEDPAGMIWISVSDCESASGLDLSRGLKRVPASRRREEDVLGLVLDMPSMLKVLDGCGEDQDFSRVARLQTFLERSVWRTRKG
jgi:hypothetical protein